MFDFGGGFNNGGSGGGGGESFDPYAYQVLSQMAQNSSSNGSSGSYQFQGGWTPEVSGRANLGGAYNAPANNTVYNIDSRYQGTSTYSPSLSSTSSPVINYQAPAATAPTISPSRPTTQTQQPQQQQQQQMQSPPSSGSSSPGGFTYQDASGRPLTQQQFLALQGRRV